MAEKKDRDQMTMDYVRELAELHQRLCVLVGKVYDMGHNETAALLSTAVVPMRQLLKAYVEELEKDIPQGVGMFGSKNTPQA